MALELHPAGTGHRRARHPCRRRGPDLPAPRGRDRPELRVHRAGGVRPVLGARRVPQDRRRPRCPSGSATSLTARDLREDGVGRRRRAAAPVRHPLPAAARSGATRRWRPRARARAGWASSATGWSARPAAPTRAPAQALADRFRVDFAAALDDDLNAPRAVAALFELVREGNRLLDEGVARRTGACRAPGRWPIGCSPWRRRAARSPWVPRSCRSSRKTAFRCVLPRSRPPIRRARKRWALRWAAVRLAEKRGAQLRRSRSYSRSPPPGRLGDPRSAGRPDRSAPQPRFRLNHSGRFGPAPRNDRSSSSVYPRTHVACGPETVVAHDRRA